MSSVIHGGDVYRYGRGIVDFSSNINPLGLPGSVREVLQGDWGHLLRYPDVEYRELRQAIAGGYTGVGAENVIVGNGAAEIIYLLGQSLRAKRVLLVEPTFGEYREAVELGGGTAETLFYREEAGWSLPLEELIARLPYNDGVWLGHPNNPTGQLIGRAALRVLLEETRRQGKFLILDEAFIDFTLQNDRSGVHRLCEHTGLFVIRAFTKWYALPGLRLGYGFGSPAWIARLRQRQIPWSVNSLAAEAGLRVLDDAAYRRRSEEWIRTEPAFLMKGLGAVEGLTVYPTSANFILCKITRSGWTAARLKEALVQRGILIRDAGTFPGLDGRYFRIAVKSRAENAMLVRAMEGAFSGPHNLE